MLAMAGKKPNEKLVDGSVIFCVGDCMMGTASSVGSYAGFQKALIKKVRELGYLVVFRSEFNTSQKFPIEGHQTSYSGSNGIRIKFCKELGIHIHRDVMAAENMADILASEILGLERPKYLRKTVSQTVKK